VAVNQDKLVAKVVAILGGSATDGLPKLACSPMFGGLADFIQVIVIIFKLIV